MIHSSNNSSGIQTSARVSLANYTLLFTLCLFQFSSIRGDLSSLSAQENNNQAFSDYLDRYISNAAYINILGLTDEQQAKIRDVAEMGDKKFKAKIDSLGRDLTFSEWHGLRTKLISEHVDTILSEHQLGLHQFVLGIHFVEPAFFKLLRDHNIRRELNVSPELQARIYEQYEDWIRSFVEKIFEGQSIESAPLNRHEFHNRFYSEIKRNADTINSKTRQRLESEFKGNKNQLERLQELELQYQLVSEGIGLFLDRRVRAELMLTDYHIEKLKKMHTLANKESWDRHIEKVNFEQDYRDFLENFLSASQKQKLKMLLGKPSSTITEWDTKGLLKNH